MEEQGTAAYRGLNHLADEIISRFSQKVPVIGIMMKFGILMAAAILAVVKPGGAYVPVKPDFLVKRSRFILKESGAELCRPKRNTPAIRTKRRFTIPTARLKPQPAQAISAAAVVSSFRRDLPIGRPVVGAAIAVMDENGKWAESAKATARQDV